LPVESSKVEEDEEKTLRGLSHALENPVLLVEVVWNKSKHTELVG